MVHAFVMMETAAGMSESVREALFDRTEVVDAHVVAGGFDVITEIDGEEVYDVLHSVTSEIQAMDGVVETKTYISLN